MAEVLKITQENFETEVLQSDKPGADQRYFPGGFNLSNTRN